MVDFDSIVPVSELPEPEAWLSDMDGVLVHENTALNGAAEFIEKLKEDKKPFLVLCKIARRGCSGLGSGLRGVCGSIPKSFEWPSSCLSACHRYATRVAKTDQN